MEREQIMYKNMKIIHKNRLPLKYLKPLCKINEASWMWGNAISDRTDVNYRLNILLDMTDRINRRHNAV